MDNRLIILGALFVVLMVAFGNNPFEEEKRKNNSDPFQQSLQRSLDKKGGVAGGGASGSGLIQGLMPNYSQQAPDPGGPMGVPNGAVALSNTFPVAQPGQVTAPNSNTQEVPLNADGSPPGSFPPANQRTGNPSRVKRGPFGTSSDWAVEEQAASLPRRRAEETMPAEQIPAFYLQDGRRVLFSGFKVFVLNKDGNIKPLPDGRFPLQSGEVIVIENGRRQAE